MMWCVINCRERGVVRLSISHMRGVRVVGKPPLKHAVDEENANDYNDHIGNIISSSSAMVINNCDLSHNNANEKQNFPL